jgi:hypothetical protein
MRGGWLGLTVLLLAGCGAPGSWTKEGADAAATLHDVEDCRAIAASAVKTDAGIDQDIVATRQDDRQRASVFRLQSETNREHTGDRAVAIVDVCMSAKGFTKTH